MTFDSRPFGKYFLIDELFAGEHSHVYKAKTFGAKGFEKILLLQVLKSKSVTSELIKKLTIEFQKIVKVSHPNIITVYDFGCVKDEHFLTQEFLDAISFADYIEFFKEKDQNVPLPQALYLIGEILKGLQAAHQKFEGTNILLHGNINPKNLVISKEGEVKVSGLGWERVALKFNISETQNFYYFDPNQKRSGKMSVNSDLFQTALVLFEMLTGFALMAKLPEDSGEDAISNDFLKLHVPESLIPIFERAFSSDTEKRYESALEMSVDIQRLLYGNFADFSSMEIVENLKSFFAKNEESLPVQKIPGLPSFQNEDTLKELVKSSQHQINFVHREGTEFSTLMADTVALPKHKVNFHPETDSMVLPSLNDQNSQMQKNEDNENTENSRKEKSFSESKNRSEGLEETPVEKSKSPKAFSKKWILISSILGGVFLLVALIIFIARNSIDPHWQDAGDETSLSLYQIWIRSYPEKAEVWIDGEKSNQLTPAIFEDFDKSKTYRVVIKKEGFKDYAEMIANTNGRDQVLDIALEPLKK